MHQRSQSFLAFLILGLVIAGFSGCSRDPNVRKQKYLESGQRYFDKGKYREASIQFQNAIQVDPRFAEAHYKLAQTDLKLQQWTNAYDELTRTIEIQPENYAARLDAANLLIANHQLKDAKEHLDILTQKQPNNADVQIAYSNYLASDQNLAGAITAMQKAIQFDPGRQDSYINLALLQMNAEQYDAAETSFKKAIDVNPKSGTAYMALGTFYQSRGRFPEAEQQFQRAIAAAPADPETRGAMARLYMAENKPDQAEAFLKKAKNDFPENSVGYRLLGDFYFANGDLDKAVAEYAAIYQQHPKDIQLKKNYIQLLILKERLPEARRLNDEILKATPDDQDAQIYKAQIEIHAGRASDAVNTLQNVIKNDPDNAIAHYQLGLAFAQLGNNRAESEWREALRTRPDIVEAHRALAGAAIQRDDVNTLAQEADQIINYQPGAPDGYLLRAVAEMDRQNYAKAEDYIKQSLEKAPNNPEAYVQLGNLRISQERLPDAQKAFQQALDLDPNASDALGGVLNIYLMQKQPDKALAAAKAQIAKSPNSSPFHLMYGHLLEQQNHDLRGAEAEYRRALELDKNNVEAYEKLGLVQGLEGSPDQALQTFLDAAKRNPKEITLYLLAGNVYEGKHDWENARQMYQRVLEVQPQNPLASNNLAYVMLQQGGNVDVALAMAQTARRQLPDNPSSADTLGWAYYHKGIYTSAIDLFKEAVKKEPDNTTYVYHLGLAYAKNGQAAQARQQLDRVMKIKPDSSEAQDLKQTLAQLKG
jgi:tetratricopeptide (TPR) repeat protein